MEMISQSKEEEEIDNTSPHTFQVRPPSPSKVPLRRYKRRPIPCSRTPENDTEIRNQTKVRGNIRRGRGKRNIRGSRKKGRQKKFSSNSDISLKNDSADESKSQDINEILEPMKNETNKSESNSIHVQHDSIDHSSSDTTPKASSLTESDPPSFNSKEDRKNNFSKMDSSSVQFREDFYPNVSSTSYSISRVKKTISHSQTFTLALKNNVLMSAKCKGINPKYVYITNQKEIHLSQKDSFNSLLEISNKFRSFILRSYPNNQLIMNVNVKSMISPFIFNRVFLATIFEPCQKTLKSQLPLLHEERGVLDFEGKFSVSSIKNGIMLDEDDKKVFSIRKISNTTLEIDNDGNLDQLIIFAFGILSWLCPY